MAKNIIICITSLLTFFGYAKAQTDKALAMPESVTSDGQHYFVSNQGKDPISKDGDGFISQIDSKGSILHLKFIPESGILNTPKGLAVVGNTLFTTDIDRVVGFDISTRQKVFELHIGKAKDLLNDICKVDDNTLAVTQTFSGEVYLINIKDKTFHLTGKVPYPNGVLYDPETHELFVNTAGKHYGDGSLFVKTLGNKERSFKELPHVPEGFYDGMVQIDEAHLLLSNWISFPTPGYGKLLIYDIKNHVAKSVKTVDSPADIYYDKKSKVIYIPESLHNKVAVLTLKELYRKVRFK